MSTGKTPEQAGADAVAEFQRHVEAERAKIRTALTDKPRVFDSCPLCGCSVIPGMRQAHIVWHLRCVQ